MSARECLRLALLFVAECGDTVLGGLFPWTPNPAEIARQALVDREAEVEVSEPHECAIREWIGAPGDKQVCPVCGLTWLAVSAGPLDIKWLPEMPAAIGAAGNSPGGVSDPGTETPGELPAPGCPTSELLTSAARLIELFTPASACANLAADLRTRADLLADIEPK